MRASLLILASTFAFVLAGCPSTPSVPPGGTDCHAACARLAELSCPFKTPEGKTCDEVLCASHGAKSSCIARASSCEDAKQKQEHGCP
jgi:hypothetical protein